MDTKSKILSEVEQLGSGYVQMMNDAFNECPTLRNVILIAEYQGVVASVDGDGCNSPSSGLSPLVRRKSTSPTEG